VDDRTYRPNAPAAARPLSRRAVLRTGLAALASLPLLAACGG
jgi:hypothetical protein